MRWVTSKTNPEYLRYLAAGASVSPIVAQILINRGIKTPEDARVFLSPSLTDLHNPMLLPDMEPAVQRILRAVERKEKILVFGDYDADGLTATTILLEALEMLGAEPGEATGFMIPNRLTDGYGLNAGAVRKAAASGYSLIVTVDCGVSAVEEASLAASLGIDLVITDHHQPPPVLPGAAALVNPHLKISKYPFAPLAGAGVAWKLACALVGLERALPLLDLAALGTAADVVPLVGENRIIVAEGLKMMSRAPRPGIFSLLCETGDRAPEEEGKKNDPVRSIILSHRISPMLNAAGRLGDAEPVIHLLRTRRPDQAAAIAGFLKENNRLRRSLDTAVSREAREMAAGDDRGVVVLASPDWHAGVLSIAASRLAEELRRPVFLFRTENGVARGSARSIPAFDLVGALGRASDCLIAFGGHHQAAGMRISTDRIDELRNRLNDIFLSEIGAEETAPSLKIDAAVELSEIGEDLLRELGRLEPFGFRNEEPVLGVRGVRPVAPKLVGRGHLKVSFRQGGRTVDAIGFDMAEDHLPLMEAGEPVDAVFIPRPNEWGGRRTVQLHLKALRAGR